MAPKVSEEYKKQKRTEILQAAATIFGVKGYYSTTMDDLVKATGVSKGAIYHYYSSKEEVYEHMLQQQVEQTIQTLEEKFAPLPSTKEKVGMLFDLYTSNEWLMEPKINNVRNQLERWIAGSRADERNIYEKHSEVFYSFLKNILQKGQESGEISMDIDTSHAAKLFWSMIDGVLLHASVLQQSYSYPEIIKTAKEMYLTFLTRGVRQ